MKRLMLSHRLVIGFLCCLAFAIPVEHKYDKLFRFFSLKLIPSSIELPDFFFKKIYFYPSDIIALLLVMASLMIFRVSFRRFFMSRFAIYLWVIFVCAFLSIIFSPLSSYAIPYIRLLQLATPFLLFSFLANGHSIEKIKLTSFILGALIVSATFQSIVAIAQYCYQGSIGLRLLNEPSVFSHFHSACGKRWIFDLEVLSERMSLIRPSGTMPHANVLGGFLCASQLASLSFFFTPKWRWFVAALLPLQFFAMSLTFSRSALFAFVLAVLIWYILQFTKRGIAAVSDIAIRTLSCSLFIAIAFAGLVLHKQVIERGGIINYNHTAQGSDALRLRYQDIALQMIKDYPIFGTGFQQFSIRALDYTSNDPTYPIASGTHNIYLYLGAETGLISLTALLLWILSLLVNSFKQPFHPQTASLIVLFIAFLLIGFCDFYPLLFQQGALPFFLTAGLLAGHLSREYVPTSYTALRQV